MNQEASDPGAVYQETELLPGGDLAENPAESSKASVQSALESNADSSSDDSEDSAGPGFDSSSSSSSGESEEKDSDDFVEVVPTPAGNPTANDGGTGAPGAAAASGKQKSKGCCWSGKQQWHASRGVSFPGIQQEEGARLLICSLQHSY